MGNLPPEQRWQMINKAVFAPLPRGAVEAVAGPEHEFDLYVIHLSVAAPDLTGALNMACAVARSLAFLPQLDVGATHVSQEDNQNVRHWVFCNMILPGRQRCGRRADHNGPCDSAGVEW